MRKALLLYVRKRRQGTGPRANDIINQERKTLECSASSTPQFLSYGHVHDYLEERLVLSGIQLTGFVSLDWYVLVIYIGERSTLASRYRVRVHFLGFALLSRISSRFDGRRTLSLLVVSSSLITNNVVRNRRAWNNGWFWFDTKVLIGTAHMDAATEAIEDADERVMFMIAMVPSVGRYLSKG